VVTPSADIAATKPQTPFKRLHTLSDEALRKQLLDVPEVALDQVPFTSRGLVVAALPTKGKSYPGPAALLRDRPALNGLPFLQGKDCRLSKESADDLRSMARDLHKHVQACTSGTGLTATTNADALHELLHQQREGHGQWHEPEALPALLQILQAEEAPVRLVLIDLLAGMDDPRADAALAMRAVVDVSAVVREAAVRGLASRPATVSRQLLLAGFRYPWQPAVAHASEALAALNDRGAVPELERLLDQPPPEMTLEALPGRQRGSGIRELVRVNHLGNCLLCHSPSFDIQDGVRGLVPIPGRAPSAGTAYYEGGVDDLFVRADVTYLRQDFSLRQPVAKLVRNWPEVQRFDYLVRVRPVTGMDLDRAHEKQQGWTREYRAAINFALRELRDDSPSAAVTAAAGPPH
jgi:hypothetical protein